MTAFTAVLRTAGLVLTGVFAGFLIAVLVIELTLRAETAASYTRTEQALLIGLPTLATVTLLPSLALTVALAVILFARGRNGRTATLAAAVLLAAAVVISVAVNLPINAQETHWSAATPPADWAQLRDRWQLAHFARTVAAVAAFALLAIAAVRTGPDRARRPIG